MPAALGGAVGARPMRTSRPVAVGEADRRAQLAGDLGGGQAHAEHEAVHRLAAHQGVDRARAASASAGSAR